MTEWTFVSVKSKKFLSSSNPESPVAKWRPDGRPSIYSVDLKPALLEWLDANCQGRWYEVRDRLKTSYAEITIRDEEKLAHVRSTSPGFVGPPTKYVRTTIEIAFELPSDALIFKLALGGE